MTEREALKLALEALQNSLKSPIWRVQCDQAITACKQALAKPEQEPVGTVKELFTQAAWEKHDLRGSTKVYTTPPQRKPLTADEISEISIDVYGYRIEKQDQFARAIEAAHGVKE